MFDELLSVMVVRVCVIAFGQHEVTGALHDLPIVISLVEKSKFFLTAALNRNTTKPRLLNQLVGFS